MERVAADVRGLVVAPLHEAVLRLNQAATTADDKRSAALLEEARSRASDVVARPNAPGGARVSAGLLLTSCWVNLGDLDLARSAIEAAETTQRDVLDEHDAATRAAKSLAATGDPAAAIRAAGGGAAAATLAGIAIAPVGVLGFTARAALRRLGRKRIAVLQQEAKSLAEVSQVLHAMAHELRGPGAAALFNSTPRAGDPRPS